MSQVSRPVQVLLAVTVLFSALWFVALRPKPGADDTAAPAAAPAAQATAPAAPGTEGLTRAIDKAHDAVTTANGDAERAAQSNADGASAAAGAAAGSASASKGGSAAAADGSSSPAKAPARSSGRTASHGGGAAPPHTTHAASDSVRVVRSALRAHKAVAIAFVDPSTADARAVARELRHVPRFGGRAIALAVPLARLSDYDFITNQVEVTVAPTTVIVDPRHQATTIVGFADRGEIEQRLADALTVKPTR